MHLEANHTNNHNNTIIIFCIVFELQCNVEVLKGSGGRGTYEIRLRSYSHSELHGCNDKLIRCLFY